MKGTRNHLTHAHRALLLAVCAACSSAHAQAPTPITVQSAHTPQEGSVIHLRVRERALTTLEAKLERVPMETIAARLDNTPDPFPSITAALRPSAPAQGTRPDEGGTLAEAPGATPTVPPAQPTPSIDWQAILQEVGKQLQDRVSGTMEIGGKRYLLPREGGFIGIDNTFNVAVESENVTVTIEQISTRSFRLRLGDLRRTFPILDAARQ